MTVRAALFDLDDTLFDHRHGAREALAAVRSSHQAFAGIEAPALDILHAGILEVLHLEVLAGRMDLDAARVERFARLFREVGHETDPDTAARMAGVYRQGYIEARRQVAGAAALLDALRPHVRIVVVSNNLLNEQRAKLRDCGLEPLVDVLVVSEEVGVPKPDPAIFIEALSRARCRAPEAVMIGDSWPNDVEGARAVGIRPVWFNPDGTPAADPSVQVITALEPTREVVALILAEDVSSTEAPGPTGPASAARR